ncbi:MAG: restriction endonuclease subunit S, partial [Bacillota bacterium]
MSWDMMGRDIKEGYKEVQLGIRERTIPKNWDISLIKDELDLELNSVNPKNLDNNKTVNLYSMPAFDENKTPKIVLAEGIGSNKYEVPSKCLLFAKLNPRKKRIWLIENEEKFSLSSTEFWPLVPKEDSSINLQFLSYYFLGDEFQSNPIIKPASSTNSHKRIKRKSFKKVRIPIPPLPEQKKIADILSSVDQAIEKTAQIIAKTKELKRGLMQELLTKGIGHDEFKEVRIGPKKVNIPVEWEVKNLGEISTVKRGASPRPISDPKWFNNNSDVGWVRISDITRTGKYLTNTEQYLSKQGIEKSRFANDGTLILSICATVGKPSILSIDACLHDGLVGFFNIESNVSTEYLYYVLLKNRE